MIAPCPPFVATSGEACLTASTETSAGGISSTFVVSIFSGSGVVSTLGSTVLSASGETGISVVSLWISFSSGSVGRYFVTWDRSFWRLFKSIRSGAARRYISPQFDSTFFITTFSNLKTQTNFKLHILLFVGRRSRDNRYVFSVPLQ